MTFSKKTTYPHYALLIVKIKNLKDPEPGGLTGTL
jgi:hypothetical protein